jgi:uncharacterized membrane protein
VALELGNDLTLKVGNHLTPKVGNHVTLKLGNALALGLYNVGNISGPRQRLLEKTAATTFLIGIAPSLLGPIGLLFFILSSSGKLSRLTLIQVTLLVTFIALGLEFVQLIPRPGILAKVHYTFDWFDILASLTSVLIGYLVALFITKKKAS